MTTKLSNPHYLPEICIKVTIINFSVTKQGLEDQILRWVRMHDPPILTLMVNIVFSDVVRLERPDLDEEMNRLIITMNNDRNQLKAIEDKILKMLFESEGNILDNEELVNSLNDSKVSVNPVDWADVDGWIALGHFHGHQTTSRRNDQNWSEYLCCTWKVSTSSETRLPVVLRRGWLEFDRSDVSVFSAIFHAVVQRDHRK